MTWDRRVHTWLPKFPEGCQVFYAEDAGMIVLDHRGKDVTSWALRPPFALVSECPYCDTSALHFMFEPSFDGDPIDSGQPVITRECARCSRQWMERMM